MNSTQETLEPPRVPRGPWTTAVLAWARGVWDVVVLEAKQRLRSRGWYILLAVWFVIIGIVTWLTWAAWEAQNAASRRYADYAPVAVPAPAAPQGPGSMIFEAVLAAVLVLGLLVTPALSANAVNGDRAQGTLAVLQTTLLRPGQILVGKLLAAWLAALVFLVAAAPFLIVGVAAGGLSPGYIAVSLLMLAVELGVVCAVGTALSAIASRSLFSIVVTYLLVAILCIGTMVGYGMGAMIARGTVMANTPSYAKPAVPSGTMSGQPSVGPSSYTCSGTLVERPAQRTERVAWLLALNPFVVVADAIPYPDRSQTTVPYPQGAIEAISQGARRALAGPEATTPCANGQPTPLYLVQGTPLWPLGLGLQIVLAGALLWGARRALVTPARRLAKGTRVA